MRPSPSLEQKVSGFEEYLEECHQQMTKFEETLLDFEEKFCSDNPNNLQRLSETMNTVQKYLIHETAEVNSGESCFSLNFISKPASLFASYVF